MRRHRESFLLRRLTRHGPILLLAIVLSLLTPFWRTVPAVASPRDPGNELVLGPCVATALFPTSAAEYYGIRMAPTGTAPGAVGKVETTFAQSPFGVAVSVDGSYLYDVSISVEGLRGPPNVDYTVWVSPPDLVPMRRLGVLSEDHELAAQVGFNKFIIFLTAERPGSWNPHRTKKGNAWEGPILLQGISRSGMMHSTAGHGPFERENC